MVPTDFPDRENRKKRELPKLKVAPPPPAMPPTKEELKAQKKKDRHTLNLLKLHIQPVMDQIKLKHKRFRTPVIDEKAIQYLFEEQNPDLVTTDLPLEERQNQLFRPFELSKDSKGNPGLLEVATGKFYYNIDTVTIEKRLSNGFYKRPKDFLTDIKTLAKDARTAGDPERTLKANELVANVEVDMTMVEQNSALVAECEAVYARELERERHALAKAAVAAAAAGTGAAAAGGKSVGGGRHGAAEQNTSSMIMLDSDVLPAAEGNVTVTTTDQSSGPVVLGEAVPGEKHVPAVLPTSSIGGVVGISGGAGSGGSGSLPGGPGPSPLSNGISVGDSMMVDSQPHQSNGADMPMPDSQDADASGSISASTGPGAGRGQESSGNSNNSTNPYGNPNVNSGGDGGGGAGGVGAGADLSISAMHPPETPSSAPNTQTQRSQKSALTQIAQGSQAADYHNSASTTTSGQKTSDRSHRSSGPQYGTQGSSSNGVGGSGGSGGGGARSGSGSGGSAHKSEHPDLSAMMPMGGGSQLPDTQGEFLFCFHGSCPFSCMNERLC